ncbi:MAG: hypothetical protein Q4E47_01990 [Candidatus Saccharibacteria bacterium]|nr:hypothetical protein [Candidatus Saccharibacteria bacterium]
MKEESQKVAVKRTASSKSGVRRMDFAPAHKRGVPSVKRAETEEDRERHEISREQMRRREMIQKQIEEDNKRESEQKRKADKARRELALKRAAEEEAERARAEKEAMVARQRRKEHLLEQRAIHEQSILAARRAEELAKRRAEQAKKELQERQSSYLKERQKKQKVEHLEDSMDPLAKSPRATKKKAPRIDLDLSHSKGLSVSGDLDLEESITKARAVSVRADEARRRMYGKVPLRMGFEEPLKDDVEDALESFGELEDEKYESPIKLDPPKYGSTSPKTGRVVTRAEEEYKALHPEVMGDVDMFASEVELALDEQPEAKKVPTIEESHSTYVPGDRSAFINIDNVEKRALGDEADTAGVEQLKSPGHRLSGKPLLGGPGHDTYVSPAEYPSAHLSSSRFESFDLTEDEDGDIVDTRSHKHARTSDTFESPVKSFAAFDEDLEPRRVDTKPKKATGRYVPYEEPIPHKNLYARKVEASKHEREEMPTMVVADKEKGSTGALIAVVILTIILGIAIGVVAYLAFFQ